MGCYTCGGNPNTWCNKCMPAEDTWVAPVDKLPDVFMGDRDHMYLLPNGDLFILSPDRTRWIKVNGTGNATAYDDAELKKRITALEAKSDKDTVTTVRQGDRVTVTKDGNDYTISANPIKAVNTTEDGKEPLVTLTPNASGDTLTLNSTRLAQEIAKVQSKADNFVSGVGVSREGNKVKLTYTFVDGTSKEVEFEDKDTVALAYDDTALKARVKALEDKPTSGKQQLSLDNNTRRLSISDGNNVTLPNDKQTLSLEGRKLSISNGNSVMLPEDTVDGGDNLICNSVFPTSTTGWGYWTSDQENTKLSLSKHSFYYNNTENMFVLSNNTQTAVPASSTRFKVKRNTKYSFNIALFATGNIKGVTLYFLGRQTGQTSHFTNIVTIKDTNNSPSTTGVYNFHATFDTGGSDEGYIRIDNKGTNNSSDSLLFFSEIDVYEGTSPRAYNLSMKCALKALNNKEDKDKQTLTLNNNVLSISNGNSVTLPNDRQTISRQGNKLVLSNGGGEVELPTPNNVTPYDDTALKRRVDALERKEDRDKQTLTLSGNTLSISNGNSVNLPQYVSPQEFTTLKNEYNQLKGAFEKLLQDLKGSGAWNQTGGNIFEGSLRPDRHIATGNINLFGGTVDGNAFIRTNNGKTENDLAGGIN